MSFGVDSLDHLDLPLVNCFVVVLHGGRERGPLPSHLCRELVIVLEQLHVARR